MARKKKSRTRKTPRLDISVIFVVTLLCVPLFSFFLSNIGEIIYSALFVGAACLGGYALYLYASYEWRGYVQDEKYRKEIFKENLLSVSWRDFELFVGRFFEKQGYLAEVTQGSKDQGVDVYLYARSDIFKRHVIGVVQCKQYTDKKVSTPEVQKLFGSHRELGVRYFFVTTSDFSQEVYKLFGQDASLKLINGNLLAKEARKLF